MHSGDGALRQSAAELAVELNFVARALQLADDVGAELVPDEDTLCATLMSAAPIMLLYIPLDMQAGYSLRTRAEITLTQEPGLPQPRFSREPQSAAMASARSVEHG